MARLRLLPWWWIVPAAIFGLHAAVFGGWLIDDAGITLAYARNVALGHGIVAQPGLVPVEGYSNPLWMALFVPLYWLGAVALPWVPKLLGAGFALAVFGGMGAVLRKLSPRWRWLAGIACTLLALNTSFVIWSVSGLENSLYALWIVLLLLGALRAVEAPSRGLGIGLGALIVATALTRPEGMAYLGMILLLPLFALTRSGGSARFRGVLGVMYAALLTFGLLYGAFLAFRLIYFHDVLPNTYWAKGGPSLDTLGALLTFQPDTVVKWRDLFVSVGGPLGDVFLAALVLGTAYLAGTRRLRRGQVVLGAFGLLALALYLLLPEDWMPEYRFATPFFVLGYLYAVLLADALLDVLATRPDWRRATAFGLVAVSLIGSLALFQPRSAAFAAHPTVPLQRVVDQYARRFDRLSALVDGAPVSVLLPDIGGMLLESHVRVYDLAGLIDRTVARTLQQGNLAGFHDYIFDEARPTFIYVRQWTTAQARLAEDPRFARLCTHLRIRRLILGG